MRLERFSIRFLFALGFGLACGESGTPAGDSTSTGMPGSETSRGEESTTTTDATTSTGAADESSTAEVLPSGPCPAGEFGNILPDSIDADTTMQADELFGTCGGNGAPDIAFLFTAPVAGSYRFHTDGSEIDTVVIVLDGTCTGDELACNDDAAGAGAAQVDVDLAEGQVVTVVVDGFAVTGGAVRVTAAKNE